MGNVTPTKKKLTTIDKIEKKYSKSSFLETYGGSVTSAILILGAFTMLCSYLCIRVYSKPIRDNWPDYKCNPAIIPFAGIIHNKAPNEVGIYTAANFEECSHTILEKIVIIFTKPIYSILDTIVKVFKIMAAEVRTIKNKLLDFLNMITGFNINISGKLANVVLGIQKYLMNIKDTIDRTSTALATFLRVILGINFAYQSILKISIWVLLGVLIILLKPIVALYTAAAIPPFLLWYLAIPATILFVIWTYMLVHWIQVMIFSVKVHNATRHSSPSCFDENTILQTKNGPIKMKNVRCGDVLGKNNKVTAIFKLLNNQKMYNLNNTIVSGTHYVYHNVSGWIQVNEHPDAILLNDYNKKYIYCINTTTKRIILNNITFADWDDLDNTDLMKMKNHHISPSTDNIHQHTDAGLISITPITLKNKIVIPIHKIIPGDILENGELVTGIVKIQAKDIKNHYIYKFKNKKIGGTNLFFTSSHLGKFLKQTTKYQDKYFYHLITNTGKFHIDNIQLYDYNSAIENTLDIRNLYL
tara:strand:+ start:3958 stop:5541 length:1584 start_codon:yes stop_codon:yes gene_type:complete